MKMPMIASLFLILMLSACASHSPQRLEVFVDEYRIMKNKLASYKDYEGKLLRQWKKILGDDVSEKKDPGEK